MEDVTVPLYCALLVLLSLIIILWTLMGRLPKAKSEIDAIESAGKGEDTLCNVTEPKLLSRLGKLKDTAKSDLNTSSKASSYLEITDDSAFLCVEDAMTGKSRAIDLHCHLSSVSDLSLGPQKPL